MFNELSNAGVATRARFAAKRGRCERRLGVPVGTEAAVQ